MNKWNRRLLSTTAGMAIMLSLVYIGKEAALHTAGRGVKDDGVRCVVVDAGHGGNDPGKVGINGAKEKDINMQIAERLRKYLEANDVKVVMTREGDEGLYDENAPNKRVQDMKRRVSLIDEASADVTVSIHQNSYPEEYVHGAQVFYYRGSRQGEELAESIQRQLVEKTDPQNTRKVKSNDSYYLLKKTGIPIVIVECGFLSNSVEAEKLCGEAYQDDVAWAIHMGILQYLNSRDE